MSIGMVAASRRILQLVSGATPKREARQPFRPVDDLRGAGLDVESAPLGADRLFELVVDLPADAGEVGAPPLRQQAEARIRVRYQRAGSATERRARQAEDVDVIRRALHGGDWQTPTTGIDALVCVNAPARIALERTDLDAAVLEVVDVPLTIIYREALAP